MKELDYKKEIETYFGQEYTLEIILKFLDEDEKFLVYQWEPIEIDSDKYIYVGISDKKEMISYATNVVLKDEKIFCRNINSTKNWRRGLKLNELQKHISEIFFKYCFPYWI